MKKFIVLFLIFSFTVIATKKQTVESEQWVAQYKGNGKITLFEGYIIGRNPVYSGLNFSHFKYEFNVLSNWDFFGTQNKVAAFFIENSDEKAVLKIKPKKGVDAVTQFIQIVGSNSDFKTIKVSINKNKAHYTFGIDEIPGIIVDGNVGKIIDTAPTFINIFMVKNIDTLIVPNLNYSFLLLGEPDHIVSNAYVDAGGDTNTIVVLKDGNLNKLIVKYGIVNSCILAGFDYISDLNTQDFPSVLSAYPPSGKINFLKARNIAAQGDYDGDWQPTTQIISAEPIPKFKVKSDRIIGDGKSVFITK